MMNYSKNAIDKQYAEGGVDIYTDMYLSCHPILNLLSGSSRHQRVPSIPSIALSHLTPTVDR